MGKLAWQIATLVASGTALFLAMRPDSQSRTQIPTRAGGIATRPPLPDSDRMALLVQLRSARTASQACELIERLEGQIGAEPLIEILDRSQLLVLRRCATTALARIDEAAALARLEQLVDDADQDVRDAAMHGLAKSEDHRARESMLELATRGNSEQRVAALLALANSGRPEATDLILRAVDAADAAGQYALATALGQSHDPATVPTLARLVSSSRDEVSMAAIRALGQIGDEASITMLDRSLNESHHYRKCRVAAEALSSIADPRARTVLIRGASSLDASTAESSLYALRGFEGADLRAIMLAKLNTADLGAQQACVYFAAHPDAAATPRLLELARASALASRAALQALSHAPGTDYQALLIELAGRPGNAQYPAIRALGDLPGGAELARPILLRVLADGGNGADLAAAGLADDNSPIARRALISVLHSGGQAASTAATSLARSSDPEALRALEELAFSNGRKSDRTLAISALSGSHGPRNEEILRRLVDDPDRDVHRQAMGALFETGGAQAEALMLHAAGSTDKQDRVLAANALTSLRSPAAISRLDEMVADPDSSVAGVALDGLLETDPNRGMTRVREMMRGGVEARRNAIQASARIEGDATRPLLLDAMRDSDQQVVTEATQSLARLGGHDAQEAIGEILRSPTSTAALKTVAARALQEMGAGSSSYHDLIERYRSGADDSDDDNDG